MLTRAWAWARARGKTTGNRNTTGKDPIHRGRTQRGGPRRGPTTVEEGHTGDPHRTHTDTNLLSLTTPGVWQGWQAHRDGGPGGRHAEYTIQKGGGGYNQKRGSRHAGQTRKAETHETENGREMYIYVHRHARTHTRTDEPCDLQSNKRKWNAI